MELQIQKMIDQVENAEQEEYLVKIKDLLSEFEKVEVEIIEYKSKKKQKLQEIENLRQTLQNAIADKNETVHKKLKVLSLWKKFF